MYFETVRDSLEKIVLTCGYNNLVDLSFCSDNLLMFSRVYDS